ncbi:MAG: mechanosensitive ion channel family protein [Flavobacteriaceae bacterium]|nr:mechanosensitive ion channel family protein [Bacteroidia bacterium]NNF74546.1 mechanosensitive ion channel family protein [Flavobacteriaceae bacterium]NNK73383.1 mechanosensitive ion channel family protein [Flavobacteriaceae bacterium]
MLNLIEDYNTQIYLGIAFFLLFLVINFIINTVIRKVAKRSSKKDMRAKLISRYISVGLLFLLLILESFLFGANWGDIAVVFSSVFAILGIALFAVWSILSNVTSGVIMFFSFPYKVGDKVAIHDKDFPITAIIEDIRAFHLHLRLENGDLVTYPNNLMLQKAVTLIEKDAIDDIL